jgi:hypothetical protein
MKEWEKGRFGVSLQYYDVENDQGDRSSALLRELTPHETNLEFVHFSMKMCCCAVVDEVVFLEISNAPSLLPEYQFSVFIQAFLAGCTVFVVEALTKPKP